MVAGEFAGALPLVAAKIRVPEVRALVRERLEQRLARIWDHRLGLVVAPAGSGKTTLLARFAATVSAPVAWYRAETADGDGQALLRYLENTLVTAVGDLVPRPWRTVEDVARALEGWSGSRALLVIDDLHAIRGSSAEALLARLVDYAPRSLGVVVSSRSEPAFDVSRLRVAGDLLEIRADDLRFRSWEVERLFSEFYEDRHPPEELAELARRMEGWAAGLQLFHLATRNRRPDERRGILAAMKTRSRLAREYLASNVLAHLPADTRRFLLDTCVLGRLTGPLCDALTGRTGSGEVLEELARSQIFTARVDPDGSFRYHEVLRSHLSAALVDEVGEAEARRRHVRAGRVLEAAGEVHDSLMAYCRGENWQAVGRLLGHEGEQIAHDTGEWLDLLPPAVAEHPWVQLATARRWRAEGRWGRALAAYRSAEDNAESHGSADISRRERLTLAAWLEPSFVEQPGWSGLVRQATVREPRDVKARASRTPGVHGTAAAGLAALLAGDVTAARVLLTSVAQSEQASPVLATAAEAGSAAAALLAGDAVAPRALDALAENAESLGIPALARLVRSLRILDSGSVASSGLPVGEPDDRWLRCLHALVAGLGALRAGEAVADDLGAAAAGFGALGAEVLQVWCLAVRALGMVRAGRPDALPAAQEAEARARAAAVPGAEALAHLALARLQPEQEAAHLDVARAIAGECGLALPGGSTSPAADDGPAVFVRCFGGFAVTVDEEALHLDTVRPRVRSLLRLLALHAGRAVHREVITEALWPGATGDVSTRGLHVAVSSLRRALPDTSGMAVVRDADAYRLDLPAGARVDVHDFEHAVAHGRRAERAGDRAAAVAAYEDALALHHGEVLPEEGPAEWLQGQRDRWEAQAADAAQSLATLLFQAGDTAGGALACKRGLEIDGYRDRLWRTLIDGLEAAGDHAAAAHERRRYEEVLAELGVDTSPTRVG